MKNILECIWLVVQIIAVIIAGYWSYNIWIKKDINDIRPQVVASSKVVSSYWGNNNKDVCKLSTLWSLKNKGQATVNVKDIKVEVLSVKNDFEYDFENKVADYSADKFEGVSEGIIKLTNPTGVISSGAQIDRDILIAFKPTTRDEMANWFSTHRVMLNISAVAYNEALQGQTITSSFKTSLKAECYQ